MFFTIESHFSLYIFQLAMIKWCVYLTRKIRKYFTRYQPVTDKKIAFVDKYWHCSIDFEFLYQILVDLRITVRSFLFSFGILNYLENYFAKKSSRKNFQEKFQVITHLVHKANIFLK